MCVVVYRSKYLGALLCLLALWNLAFQLTWHPRDLPPMQQQFLADQYAPLRIPPVALFYHAYFPKDGVENSFRVVEEQLGQVVASKLRPTRFYTTTIGRDVLNVTYLQEHVPGTVHSIEHHHKGFEEVTLQKLYEYCRQHPDSHVIYLHAKGTYHPTPGAERWRRGMTQAVVDHCDDSCDTCGLTLSPLWTPFYPGNMWRARCSYVRRLIPPMEMEDRLREVQAAYSTYGLEGRLYNTSQPDHVGLGRWSSELWIASHPTVKPCDVSNPPFFRRAPNTTFRLQSAPRTSFEEPVFHLKEAIKEEVLRNETLRRREVFLLPGQLLRWHLLYNSIPPDNSWVWTWFPDGAAWMNAWKSRGILALRTNEAA